MKRVTNLRGMIFTKDCVFEPGELVIEDGIIKEVRTCEYEALVQKEQERYLIPGLVDVHLHGAVGYDFCHQRPDSCLFSGNPPELAVGDGTQAVIHSVHCEGEAPSA